MYKPYGSLYDVSYIRYNLYIEVTAKNAVKYVSKFGLCSKNRSLTQSTIKRSKVSKIPNKIQKIYITIFNVSKSFSNFFFLKNRRS